ncbi:MAG: hypothetical protein V2A75_11605 [Pseudomonadota bacterium]
MSNPHVSRLKKHFPTYIYPTISTCLIDHKGVGATILICCAIDTLASYAASSPSHQGNKKKFINFVEKYFSNDYDPEQFYKMVRCGLVHSFNMEHTYTILCSKVTWAQELHLTTSKEFNYQIILNPYTLFRDLKKAHKAFILDLENDIELRKIFSKLYINSPILKQQTRIIKAVKKVSHQNSILDN